jgi:signal transduction histidine kinase
MIAMDGREVWFRHSLHVVMEDQIPKELIGIMLDVTQNKQQEAALRVLSGRLITVQEEERQRIARELHDDLSQRLALLAIGLDQLRQSHTPNDPVRRRAEELHTLAQELSSDMRRLSQQLHPVRLEQLGLVPTLSNYCRRLRQQYGVRIEFLHRHIPRSLSNDTALCLFRVAQEALNNTVKHSRAKMGQLALVRDGSTLHLRVSDSGIGFDPLSVSTKGTLGLISMQERVRAIGGQFALESQPSQGTRIMVDVPVQVSSQHDEEVTRAPDSGIAR